MSPDHASVDSNSLYVATTDLLLGGQTSSFEGSTPNCLCKSAYLLYTSYKWQLLSIISHYLGVFIDSSVVEKPPDGEDKI